MKRFSMILVVMGMVLSLNSVVSGAVVNIGGYDYGETFMDLMDPSATVQFLQSFLGADAASSHNLMLRDEFGVETIVSAGSNYQLGLVKFWTQDTLEYIGGVNNVNYVSTFPGYDGHLYGMLNEHLGDGFRPDLCILVRVDNEDGYLYRDDGFNVDYLNNLVIWPGQPNPEFELLFGPDRLRWDEGGSDLMPAWEYGSGTAILPEIVVAEVPEPVTMTTLAIGGIALLRRRKE